MKPQASACIGVFDQHRALAGPVPVGRRRSGASPLSVPPAMDGNASLQRAIGIEFEVDRPVVTDEGEPVAYRDKETALWSSGHTIVVSSAGYKIVSDLRFSADGAPYTVAEFVTEPLPVLPGEEEYFAYNPGKVLDAIEVAYGKLYSSSASPFLPAPTSDEASSSKPSGKKTSGKKFPEKKIQKKKASQGKPSSSGLRRSGRSTKQTDRYAPPDPKKKGT